MNVLLLENFQPGALQCTKTRGKIWKNLSNPCALLPIFHLPSQSSQTQLWAWLLREMPMAWRADRTCELGMGGRGLCGVRNPPKLQPWDVHLLAAVRSISHLALGPFQTLIKVFLKEWNKAHSFAARDIWNVLKSLSLPWWELSKQLETEVCSLLCWRGFESASHKRYNYQVVGLWGRKGHCAGEKRLIRDSREKGWKKQQEC